MERNEAVIVWLRQDLRLEEHAALEWAARAGGPVVPVFLWPGSLGREEDDPWAPGAAAREWLHHSLAALDAALRRRGSRLILRRGASAQVLTELARETGAGAVVWQRRYEPAARRQERAAEDALRALGVRIQIFPGNVLAEPGSILTGAGKPYTVFTPFWKALQGREAQWLEGAPCPAPRRLGAPGRWPASLTLAELGLAPEGGAGRLGAGRWRPGEAGALRQAAAFLKGRILAYPEARDQVAEDGTSRLSPHLALGEVSPAALWRLARAWAEAEGGAAAEAAALAWRRQLAWREFAYHLLVHFPYTPEEPLRPDFARFPWAEGDSGAATLAAWQRGQTGAALVDAGLRQLARTGWMHNRARMVAASFLVKDLLISWRDGARWFWESLLDADLACNTLGWQWVAGCGADAAPFFRIFNPERQRERFDPTGAYVARWAPEYLRPGAACPEPIVDHAHAARRALVAYARIKRSVAER